MEAGLIVDSACELPYSFMKENGIFVLPISVRIDGRTFVDDHDPDKVAQFYRSGLLSIGHQAETEAYSVEQICELFLNEIVTNYDFAFLETITSSRSLIYQNASEAMLRIVSGYRPYRRRAGRGGPFSMRVVDSGSFFAGQGLLAAHTVHLIKQGIGKHELRQQVTALTDSIYGALVPYDLHYLRERARRRGDNTVTALAAFLGRALHIVPVLWGHGDQGTAVFKSRSYEVSVRRVMDYACTRVRRGLRTPYVVLNAGLPQAEIERLPGFAELRDTCAEHDVTLLASPCGITSSIYIGPGSVMLALAAEPHGFGDRA